MKRLLALVLALMLPLSLIPTCFAESNGWQAINELYGIDFYIPEAMSTLGSVDHFLGWYEDEEILDDYITTTALVIFPVNVERPLIGLDHDIIAHQSAATIIDYALNLMMNWQEFRKNEGFDVNFTRTGVVLSSSVNINKSHMYSFLRKKIIIE